MTLLLSLVTPDFVVQASDRRVSYADGQVGDVWNKAVVVSNVATIAYTGLASLDGREPTDHLIMRCCAESFAARDGGLAQRLKVAASDAVRRNRTLPTDPDERSRLARTSIVMVGFARMPEQIRQEARLVSESWTPFLTVTTNAQDNLDQDWRDSADDAGFSLLISPLESDCPYILHICGQRLAAPEEAALHRVVRRALKRCHQPETLGRLLARAIQRVATRNRSVGGSVMCVYARRSFASSRDHESARSLGACHVPVGCSGSEYERRAFSASREAPTVHAFLPGPDDTPGIFYFPAYVNPALQMDGAALIHESIDQGQVRDVWLDRHKARRFPDSPSR